MVIQFWRYVLSIVVAFLLFFIGSSVLHAQVQGNQWAGPRLLSSPGVEDAGEAVMVPDPYGYLHLFWSEKNPDDNVYTIQHTRFDGELWTEPVDIVATAPRVEINSYSADIDEKGVIHLVWTQGNTGPVFYSFAPAHQALTAHDWSTPQAIDIPAYEVKVIAKQGVLHLLYTNFYADEPGVYYMHSEDGGKDWSPAVWLDPDIPLSDAPSILRFKSDDRNGLHATWYYLNLDQSPALGHWVRYIHSLDGGETWSDPFTIDIAENEADPDELRLPAPGLAITGDQVDVVWAGTVSTEREHRYSNDRGMTWSDTERIMGQLGGQAIGDGLAVDAAGRIHFLAQLRWPQGVYHAIWDKDHWTTPTMIYLIARSDAEGRNGRYHAHNVRAAVRAGSQLVVTFTDEPAGPLYIMYSTLGDVVPLPPLPTPTPMLNENAAAPAITTTATPFPITSSSGPPLVNNPQGVPNFGGPVWLGVLPVVILLFLIILLRLIQKKFL